MAQAYTAGGDITATTQVGALVQLLGLLQVAEDSFNAANPTRVKNNVTASVSLDDKTLQATATLPVTQSVNAAGVFTITATDYLGAAYTAFAPGTELESTNLVAAFLEQAVVVQGFELSVPEADRPNAVQVSLESDASTVTVTLAIPATISLNNTGALVISPTDYL